VRPETSPLKIANQRLSGGTSDPLRRAWRRAGATCCGLGSGQL